MGDKMLGAFPTAAGVCLGSACRRPWEKSGCRRRANGVISFSASSGLSGHGTSSQRLASASASWCLSPWVA